MAPEGYRLSVNDGGIEIAASGERGVMNAVATLTQLRSGNAIYAADVDDAPDVPYRGVIEGFYGAAWTHDFRLELFRFMGQCKLNTYIYAPKDDALHRARWRSKYTGKALERMKELCGTAAANNVRFVYAISPGLDIDLGSGYEKELRTLLDKCGSLYEIGVRDFAILLDDIETLDPAGHAKLLNDFETEFCRKREGVSDLIAITTEFCDAMLGKYTDEIAPLLDPAIKLMWTGPGVVPDSITSSSLQNINNKLGRKVFIWLNYPVNDTMGDNLFMAPCTGLGKDLKDHISGLVSNPMNQGRASLVPLFTVADFLWNSEAYDPEASLDAAAKMLEPDCFDGYRTFIGLTRASVINGGRSAFTGEKLLMKYAESPDSVTEEDLSVLSGIFDDLASGLSDLRKNGGKELVAEIEPWLAKAEAYAEAGQCLTFLERRGDNIDPGDPETADRISRLNAANDVRRKNPKIVSPDILTAAFGKLRQRIGRFLEAGGIATSSGAEPSTNLPVYESYDPYNAVDGYDETYFWSAGAPSAGSYFMLDYGEKMSFSGVTLLMGAPGHNDDYLRSGRVEYSEDGKSWKLIGNVSGRKFSSEVPFEARYVQVYCTGSQIYWTIIREFEAKKA